MERVQVEDNQLRVCSVRACKQTVPGSIFFFSIPERSTKPMGHHFVVNYEYKMCPACRVRYQKYGTTKRAKWKVVREKEKQKASRVSVDSEAPRPPTQPSDPIHDVGKFNTPLADPLPAEKTHTPNIETDVPTERDHITTATPSRPSADDLNIPSVQPQLLPLMHQPPAALHSSSSSSSSPKVSFIHEQVPRPHSNPSATGYLESDPIVNGFSKFRVELFEGELDGRYTEGTVINAPHVMRLGEPSKTVTNPLPSPPTVSLQRTLEMSTEDHVKVWFIVCFSQNSNFDFTRYHMMQAIWNQRKLPA